MKEFTGKTFNELVEYIRAISPYSTEQINKTFNNTLDIIIYLSDTLLDIKNRCKEEDGYKSGEEGYEWTDGVREGRYSLAQEILKIIEEDEHI